jgi:hypothetical protein
VTSRLARRRLLQGAAAVTTAAATVALTQVTASGSFSAVDANTGNTASSSASFCIATPTTLYSTGDSWTDESAQTVNHQNDLELRVRSLSGGDRHTWIGFGTPPGPPGTHCQLAQAKLRFYNKVPSSGRNIDVYRAPASPVWTAATILWNNEPTGPFGTAATNAATTATPGWQEWDVTAHVLAQYTNGDNGFLLRDRAENAATAAEQVYYDRQDVTHRPTLVLTWG